MQKKIRTRLYMAPSQALSTLISSYQYHHWIITVMLKSLLLFPILNKCSSHRWSILTENSGKIRLWKWIFLVPRNFFTWTSISKMAVEMNLIIITKNNAADADPEIGFVAKSTAACRNISPRGVNGCRLDSTQTG